MKRSRLNPGKASLRRVPFKAGKAEPRPSKLPVRARVEADLHPSSGVVIAPSEGRKGTHVSVEFNGPAGKSMLLVPRDGLKSKSKLRQVNPERRAEKHMRNFDGGIEHDTYVRSQPCCVCGRFDTAAAHIETRGMGGSGKGFWFKTAPLCNNPFNERPSCHDIFDGRAGSLRFTAETKAMVEATAHRLAVQHLAEHVGVSIVFPNQETGRL